MAHPFALNSFRIASQEQIDTIRGLDIERIRFSPEQSLPPPPPTLVAGTSVAAASSTAEASATTNGTAPVDSIADPASVARQQRREQLSNQRASLQRCENRFSDATKSYRQVAESAHNRPAFARQQCESAVTALLAELSEQEESCIRLLSEKAGEKTSLHAINVTVISLLLGKALGLDEDHMKYLGMGALLHDLGKLDLPDRLRWRDDQFTSAERQIYQGHVGHGLSISRSMGLPNEVQQVIDQHHELDDGSGYPRRLKGSQIAELARVVALVNHYDNLCNPGNPALAITPHEALSLIYAQAKRQFDQRTLGLFIRMMGVYPPGSVLELNDGRYAMVASVNSSRPLRPQIIIHDSAIPAEEAMIVDLEHAPDLGIHRSLKPLQLPRAAFDYLSPRKRLCYFFERGREAPPANVDAEVAQ
jgi:putative nucleotidyltransferase with HDIG domain